MDAGRLIAGLGNPGRQYQGTRHNVGFDVVECLANRLGTTLQFERKFNAELARGHADEVPVILCRPFTFMNLSGESIVGVRDFFRISLDHMLIVVDDADLPLGKLRLRTEGSSGGHHGLESIEHRLGGERRFARQRVGIGRHQAERRNLTGHVLGRWQAQELELYRDVLQRATEQAWAWATKGANTAIARYNGTINLNENKS